MGALLLSLSIVAACAVPGRVLVNEVLYDAAGDDTGWEYVELLNPGSSPQSLAGLRIEAGDGSQSGRWTLRWTGQAGDSIAALARFVVGGSRVTPPVDRIVTLELQNGPDAIRLVWPDGASEVVGWGAHEFAEYHCGGWAPDVASGSALARIPDGSDSGSNAGDFRAAVPTPGSANQPGRSAAIVRGRSRLVPERPASGASATFELTIENRGVEAWREGEAVLALEGEALAVPLALPIAGLAPADSLRHAVVLHALRASRGALIARVSLAGDASPADDSDTLRVRVGEAPVVLTEVQFHPAQGEGEWVELRNASLEPVDLRGWTISDRSGTRAEVPRSVLLQPDSLLVLAQSRAMLIARFHGLDTSRVIALSPWPSLNNTDDSAGVADVIELREVDGVLAARLAYSAAGVRNGLPLEWIDGAWRAAEGSGSPLAPPARFVAAEVSLATTRPRIAMGAPLELSWSLPWPRARATLEIHDLSGRRLARLMSGEVISGRGARSFGALALPAGLCLVRLTARPEVGDAIVTRTLPVRFEEPSR